MNVQTIYRKLFLSQYFFTIAIRKRSYNILQDRHFCPAYVMPANRYRWAADPMLVDHEDKTYIFYEVVEHDRGHIAVSEVKEDCTLSEPQVVLKDATHYSYPFLFCRNDTWYMIPESSEAREVRLYRSVKFPAEWEFYQVLLKERAVDTTVFEEDGQYYLLTFLTDGLSERVTPCAYAMDFLDSGVKLRCLQWREFDELRVRGAGPVFREGNQLYRPAQISQEQRYGDALVFYRIDPSDEYGETPEFELTDTDLSVSRIYADGLHTYCRSARFEAIDLRCREFELLKPVRKLLSVFNR